MKFLYWLIAVPIIAVIASFAVSNRESVALVLWPLPFEMGAPLYLPVLAALALGLLIGIVVFGLAAARWRFRARRLERDRDRLQQELEQARRDAEEARGRADQRQISHGGTAA